MCAFPSAHVRDGDGKHSMIARTTAKEVSVHVCICFLLVYSHQEAQVFRCLCFVFVMYLCFVSHQTSKVLGSFSQLPWRSVHIGYLADTRCSSSCIETLGCVVVRGAFVCGKTPNLSQVLH